MAVGRGVGVAGTGVGLAYTNGAGVVEVAGEGEDSGEVGMSPRPLRTANATRPMIRRLRHPASSAFIAYIIYQSVKCSCQGA